MKTKLPKIIIGAILLVISSISPDDASAVTIATENQAWNSELSVWQTLQELGTTLSGTAQSFTFRVSTAAPNANQFDFTAQNSRIYDKNNGNSYIGGCVAADSNPADQLRGLTFSTAGVPTGYEDVTIDFSCRNYDFISGHRYLILITNANIGNSGSGMILFATAVYGASSGLDYFTGGGVRYGNGNIFDYDNNGGSCNPVNYVWNSQTSNSGCLIFGGAKSDLYFTLTNTALPPPPPRLPVVFIPGIGGSEMKTSQDIIWSQNDGHGGTYSHAYAGGEKIWVNQDKAAELGDDDYFDVLRLKTDGVTSEADLSLTGNLTSFGYPDIDSFFTGMGYTKGTNYFVFPYDWRKDVRSTKDDLDILIESAKQKSGQSKVNLVVHSMGGLIGRYYISDAGRAAKINKLIELGVPHLGSVDSLKSLMYGIALKSKIFGIFPIGIPASEIKDTSQNMASVFQLSPSNQYYSFYNNSDQEHPFPFRDDRDIDHNKVTGNLNYDQTKSLLSNLSYNMPVFGLAEQFHNLLDPQSSQTNGAKVYEIVGTAQPTLGQLHETWWITWPVNLISKTDEVFINGDDTVPLYSASLKSDSQDISGATKIYYVEQKHSDLVSANGTAMQTVKTILNDDNSLPVEVKDQKIVLEGEQISIDDASLDIYDDNNNHTGLKPNGDIEINIPNTFYDSIGNTKHIFVKKSSPKVTAKITSSKITKTNVKIRNYLQDSIVKTIFYNDVPINSSSTIQFVIDSNSSSTPTLSTGTKTILASSEATGSAALDQTPPTTSIQISGTKDSSGVYTGPVTITLTGNDSGSGILRIEYSLDNGQTVQTYTGPFTISASGKTTIQVKSIDNLGNEEIPQSITIEIAAQPTPTPTTSSTTDSPTSNTSSSAANTSGVGFDSPEVNSGSETTKQSPNSISSPAVLGITFANPNHISDQINVSNILQKPYLNIEKPPLNPAAQILGGLLIVSGGIATVASIGLLATFLEPFPK